MEDFPPDQMFGRSGLRVTLIDYGLSRAKIGNEIVYKDLEKDLELFHAPQMLQNDTYRRYVPFSSSQILTNWFRMRTFLLEGKRVHRGKKFQVAQQPKKGDQYKSWAEHLPYTNVLWIRYLTSWLQDNFEYFGDPLVCRLFRRETAEMRVRLNPQTKPEAGGFESAEEVLEFMINQGWVTRQQALDGYF